MEQYSPEYIAQRKRENDAQYEEEVWQEIERAITRAGGTIPMYTGKRFQATMNRRFANPEAVDTQQQDPKDVPTGVASLQEAIHTKVQEWLR